MARIMPLVMNLLCVAGALEKQRQMYEEKLEELRNQMTPMSKSPYGMERASSLSSFSSGYGSRMSWSDDA